MCEICESALDDYYYTQEERAHLIIAIQTLEDLLAANSISFEPLLDEEDDAFEDFDDYTLDLHREDLLEEIDRTNRYEQKHVN